MNIKRASKLIYILAGIIALSLSVLLYLEKVEFVIIIAVVCGFIVMILLMVLMEYLFNKSNIVQLEELSELIDNLINMKDDLVFSDVEDNMMSKLQSQVIKLNSILRARNDGIEKERQEIKSLVSDIAHQLKTPVASLKMYTELLMEEEASAEDRENYLPVLEEAMDKLVFLTDSMIKMSRLESGVIRIEHEPAELEPIVLGAVKDAYPKAKNRKIEIIYDGVCDVVLSLDSRWTREALFNIIDNGIKYSPEGSKIRLGIIRYPSFMCVKIEDNGPGIPEAEQAKVFQRFYRGENAKASEGAGIGLYLSREIINIQGGHIKLDSDESGSRFSVFLPLGDASTRDDASGRQEK